MSYYLKFFGNDATNKPAQKAFKSKPITINADLNRKLVELGSKSTVQLEYIEFMGGFYMLVGYIYLRGKSHRVRLTINKQFKNDKYVISPELVRLLDGEISGIDELILDAKNPVFFVLIRTNLLSNFTRKKDLKMSGFLDGYSVSSEDTDLVSIFEEKEKYLKNIQMNLKFEHYFFGQLFKTTLPTLQKADLDIIQNLAKEYIDSLNENKTMDSNLERSKIMYMYQMEQYDKINRNIVHQNQGQNDSRDNDYMSFLEMTEETFKNLIIKFGKKSVREWSMKEYKIYEWVLHSDNFLAFFFENKEDKVFYEEIKEFETTGLVLSDDKDSSEKEGLAMIGSGNEFEKSKDFYINLSPGETHMLILRIENNRQDYFYRYRTKFKIFGFNHI